MNDNEKQCEPSDVQLKELAASFCIYDDFGSGTPLEIFIDGYRAAQRAASDVTEQGGAAHDLDHMGICRRCEQGITAAEIIDGAQRCPALTEHGDNDV